LVLGALRGFPDKMLRDCPDTMLRTLPTTSCEVQPSGLSTMMTPSK
jgi:hypothetical protein